MRKEKRATGMDAMGKPISIDQRIKAAKNAEEMGLSPAKSFECINRVAEQLERDKPFEAQKIGMEYFDLTGTYRLFAVLLT